MVECHKNKETSGSPDAISSKDMKPLPDNFLPVFFRNQFLTTIELPTKEMYPNVSGKTAIITGSNTGLGLEAARQLLGLGLSKLVLAVRSIQKGEDAASKLRAANRSATILVWKLDMDSYDSVQHFADECATKLERIDITILNAGISPTTFAINQSTGHENTIQVNHLSTALLAMLLIPIIQNKRPATNVMDTPCLTFVNSAMAQLCTIPNRDQRPFLPSFDDLQITPWSPSERYGVSKFLSQLFIIRLTSIVSVNDLLINMVDPGLTKDTGLSGDAKGVLRIVSKAFKSSAGRTVDRGAATYVNAVLGQGPKSHGSFLMNCNIAPLSRWYYSLGPQLMDVVWKETMDELSFAEIQRFSSAQ